MRLKEAEIPEDETLKEISADRKKIDDLYEEYLAKLVEIKSIIDNYHNLQHATRTKLHRILRQVIFKKC